MSNQTFVKKDRISFAQNSNEQIVIAPSNITTNALYIGPNSAITYDELSNVTNINTLAGVTLSNQYIYADGTYLSNLPTTSAVTQSNLNSTITGLGSIGYISSSQLTSTVSGLANLGYISSLNSISSLNISSGNLFANVISTLNINASSMTLDKLFAGPSLGATTTQNLYPFSAGAQLGFGSNTAQFGFYAEGHFKSTFTQVIQPSLDNDGFSNIVRINGNISTQQITTSSINANNIFTVGFTASTTTVSTILGVQLLSTLNSGSIITSNIQTQIIQSRGGTALTINSTVLPGIFGSNIGGNSAGSRFGVLNAQNLNISSIIPYTGILSITDTLSSQNIIVSSLTGLNIVTSNFSSFFYGGIEKYNYISSVALESSIVGLGSIGYISSSQLQSTVRGLGNIYLSSFNGSTTFLSSAVANISSLTVNSLTVGSGAGWVDFGAIRAVIVSSIQTNTGLLNASSITGDGSQIFNLPAISSLSLQSTIIGLGTFGYISSASLYSSIQSYGFVSSSTLQSSLIGLGTLGYISSSQLQSTIIGLGTFGYISSASLYSSIQSYGFVSSSTLQSSLIGLGTLGYISSSQLQSTVRGLGSIGYISSLSSISSFNISSGNLFANVISTQNINVSTMRIERIFGGPSLGATTTQNLYPFSAGAVLGFGSNTGQLGFYAEGHFRSTFTQVIQPSLDNDGFSNIVRINGNISTPSILVSTITVNTITASTIFASTISTQILITNSIFGTTGGGAYTSGNIYPQGVNIFGFGTGGPGNGPWDSASIRQTFTSSILTNNISSGNIFVSSIFTNNINASSIRVFGTLSTENQVVSTMTVYTINASTIFASTLSSQTITGSNVFGTTGYFNLLQTYTSSRLSVPYVVPQGDNGYELGSVQNRWTRTFTMSTVTNTITPMVSLTVPNPGFFDINSTIRMFGTVSTQNMQVSSIVSGNFTLTTGGFIQKVVTSAVAPSGTVSLDLTQGNVFSFTTAMASSATANFTTLNGVIGSTYYVNFLTGATPGNITFTGNTGATTISATGMSLTGSGAVSIGLYGAAQAFTPVATTRYMFNCIVIAA